MNVRTIVKNIQDKATEIIKGMSEPTNIIILVYSINTICYSIIYLYMHADELQKVSTESCGIYVDKETMVRDLVLPAHNCFCAFVKNDVKVMKEEFFETVPDKEYSKDLYRENYDKPQDDNMKKVAIKYSGRKDLLRLLPCDTKTESKYTMAFVGILFSYCSGNIAVIYSAQIFQLHEICSRNIQCWYFFIISSAEIFE